MLAWRGSTPAYTIRKKNSKAENLFTHRKQQNLVNSAQLLILLLLELRIFIVSFVFCIIGNNQLKECRCSAYHFIPKCVVLPLLAGFLRQLMLAPSSQSESNENLYCISMSNQRIDDDLPGHNCFCLLRNICT